LIEIIGKRLELIDDKPAVSVTFSVIAAKGSAATAITMRATAVLDGDELESDPPAGTSPARVLWWTSPKGNRQTADTLVVPASSTGEWTVTVSALDDAMLGVTLDGEPRTQS
jgi:hypothetical protein